MAIKRIPRKTKAKEKPLSKNEVIDDNKGKSLITKTSDRSNNKTSKTQTVSSRQSDITKVIFQTSKQQKEQIKNAEKHSQIASQCTV